MELVIALLMWFGAYTNPQADMVQDDQHIIIEEVQQAAPGDVVIPDPDEL